MSASERCLNCGYPSDAHDWDGACPTCDEDAELFTLENAMTEPTPDTEAAPWESAMILAGLAVAPPHVRYRALSRLGKLLQLWPVPQDCEQRRQVALEMLATYHDSAYAETN